MEGVISEPENGAEVGVDHPEIPAPEDMWGHPGLDSTPASEECGEQQSTTATAPEVGIGGAYGPVRHLEWSLGIF